MGQQTSYHTCNVKPAATYILMVCCKNVEGNGFWSKRSDPARASLGPTSARSENTHPMAVGLALIPAPLPTPGTAGVTAENFTEYYTE